jgi:hypothetical protein
MTAPTRDRGYDAHRAAVKHLDACDELADAWDAGDLDDDDAPDAERVEEIATAGPYCGCRDCEVREVLAAAWPHAIAAAADLVARIEGPCDAGRAAAVLRAEVGRCLLAGHEVPA